MRMEMNKNGEDYRGDRLLYTFFSFFNLPYSYGQDALPLSGVCPHPSPADAWHSVHGRTGSKTNAWLVLRLSLWGFGAGAFARCP
jgi:hypothetical protein